MRRYVYIALLLISVLFMASCYRSFTSYFLEECENEGLTDSQAQAALDAYLKMWLMEEQEDGTFAIDRTKISIEDARNMARNFLGDLDYVLTPPQPGAYSRGWQNMLRAVPDLREGLEREEVKWKFIDVQLSRIWLHFEFEEELGNDATDAEKQYKLTHLKPSSIEDYPFVVDYLERARESGSLEQNEYFLVSLDTPYKYKDPDPDAPGDINSFVWRGVQWGFVGISYRVGNDKPPKENRADYCEFYRAVIEDDIISLEERPCIRAFRKVTGSRLELMLVDYDREEEPGYGDVDEVLSCFGVLGSNLYKTRSTLFEKLIESQVQKTERLRDYSLPELQLQIVHVGELAEYKGEFNEDGWLVPYDYKDKYEIDWAVKVIMVEQEDSTYPFEAIDLVVKRWMSATVWEVWTPIEEYAGELEGAAYGSGRNVSLQRRGQSKETGIPAVNLCNELVSIYYKDGDIWVKIYDADEIGILQYKIEDVPNPNKAPVSQPISQPEEGPGMYRGGGY